MLNIALTFSDEDNNGIKHVSKALDSALPSVYVAGVNSVPHISITHIDGEKDEAATMWQTLLTRGLELEYDVIIKTFYVDAPWNERIYTGFSMEEFGKFSKLQGIVMATFPDKEVYSGLGADFMPHITTSCHLDIANARQIRPQKPPFKRLKAYLTLGTRDSYGRMEEVLFRSEIKG